MRRRAFITLIGAATASFPFVAAAQRKSRATIGFLGASTASAMSEWVGAFVRRLHELGWSEDRNLLIEYRWADGRTERLAEIAAELIDLKVDVIVTYGTASVRATKQVTSVTPIVFAGVGDPVRAGLVASLARPGGNVTGLSIQQPDSAPKRLELLREAIPGLKRLAIMAHVVDNRSAVLDMQQIEEAAVGLGLHPVVIEIHHPGEIGPAVEGLKGRADALYVVTDPLLFSNRIKINILAIGIRVPTMCG